jgi:hypothetical protein
MSYKLKEKELSFLKKRYDSFLKVSKQISELQRVINEKSILRHELDVILNEYVGVLGLDPNDSILDLESGQILSKKEEEEKKLKKTEGKEK